ncbi:MAG: hypothetical protein Q8S01_03405 [Ignavibacteria bacterium]|nr:hypothetical protein [Ignavibacteria bacterium]
MIRFANIFLILLAFFFSSCDKESAGNPNLHGVWESTTTDLKLNFQDGNFTARTDYPLFSNSFVVYTGEYKLDGSNIYFTVYQVEWLDQAVMAEPKIMKYEKPFVEHYQFKITGETVEFKPDNRQAPYSLIDNEGIFVKKN